MRRTNKRNIRRLSEIMPESDSDSDDQSDFDSSSEKDTVSGSSNDAEKYVPSFDDDSDKDDNDLEHCTNDDLDDVEISQGFTKFEGLETQPNCLDLQMERIPKKKRATKKKNTVEDKATMIHNNINDTNVGLVDSFATSTKSSSYTNAPSSRKVKANKKLIQDDNVTECNLKPDYVKDEILKESSRSVSPIEQECVSSLFQLSSGKHSCEIPKLKAITGSELIDAPNNTNKSISISSNSHEIQSIQIHNNDNYGHKRSFKKEENLSASSQSYDQNSMTVDQGQKGKNKSSKKRKKTTPRSTPPTQPKPQISGTKSLHTDIHDDKKINTENLPNMSESSLSKLTMESQESHDTLSNDKMYGEKKKKKKKKKVESSQAPTKKNMPASSNSSSKPSPQKTVTEMNLSSEVSIPSQTSTSNPTTKTTTSTTHKQDKTNDNKRKKAIKEKSKPSHTSSKNKNTEPDLKKIKTNSSETSINQSTKIDPPTMKLDATEVEQKSKVPAQSKSKSKASIPKPKAEPTRKSKKRNLQDRVLHQMLIGAKPYNLKTLAQISKTTEEALSSIMLSLLDKKLVYKREFDSKRNSRSKILYWANQDSKTKDAMNAKASLSEIKEAKQECQSLLSAYQSITKELDSVRKIPTNNELEENIKKKEIDLDLVQSEINDIKKRIHEMEQEQQRVRDRNNKIGRNSKKAAMIDVDLTPHRLKIQINEKRIEWKKRKEKCMDFVDQLSDAMEKKLKDTLKVLDLETDESVGVKMPSKYVID